MATFSYHRQPSGVGSGQKSAAAKVVAPPPTVTALRPTASAPSTPGNGGGRSGDGTALDIGPVTRMDQLPAFERIFGTGPKDPNFNDASRSGAAGLVHSDGTVTLLIARNHEHLVSQYGDLLKRSGLQLRDPVRPSTSDFILALFQQTSSAADRRSQYDSASDPAEANKVLIVILEEAMRQGASDVDIHVLDLDTPPQANTYFRVHGKLIKQEGVLTNPSVASAVLRAAYTGDFADAKSRSHTSFTTVEGMYATLQIPQLKNVRLRFQSNPHILGHGVNLRILSYDGLQTRFANLQAMGFSAEHERDIIDAFSGERGGLILFIAGTGEGKTSTVMTAIPEDRNFDHRKWISIEDPVEIVNRKIFQIPIQRKTGVATDVAGYIAAMSNTLRFDPDGINAGEIRDEISATLAERAAMTGHITTATLHGTEPFTAFHRLIDLGARKVNLLDGVARLFCHQKLIQTICPHCSPKAVDSKNQDDRVFLRQLHDLYGVEVVNVRVQGKGCDRCYPVGNPLAGIKGRTVVAEVVRFTSDIVDALRSSDDTEPARQAWRSLRVAEYNEPGTLGKTIGEHALYKLLKGEVSPETYLGIAGQFDTHRPMDVRGRERRRA